MIKHPIIVAGLLLAMFALGGSGLVAFTYDQTAQRIKDNEREALLNNLHALVPAESINNDIVTDVVAVSAPDMLGGEAIQVYRGRMDGKPVATVFTTTVPNGYSGPIKLLVAVNSDKTLGGVRVVSHKETPGLGDKIEEAKSDWIYGFAGKSLTNPDIARWKVKRDGGDFDQFTGATITPRSIVLAVKNTLIYYKNNATKLFDMPATKVAETN